MSQSNTNNDDSSAINGTRRRQVLTPDVAGIPSSTFDVNNLTNTVRSRDPPIESTVSAAGTMTITETEPNNQPRVLSLTLRPPPRVTWDDSVQDNEGLGRKSSKRCCIFHKQRAFGESSTESSDSGEDSDSSSDGGFAPKKNNKIARPKNNKVPDFQRFHA